MLLNLNFKVGLSYGIPIDPASLVSTATRVIKHGVCLLGDHAVAGATVQPWLFNQNIIVGNIIFWNFTKPKGIGIFDAMVKALAARGATHISASSHFPKNRIGDFYCQKMMKQVELQWLGDIRIMNEHGNQSKLPEGK